jgi:hypothetical protein
MCTLTPRGLELSRPGPPSGAGVPPLTPCRVLLFERSCWTKRCPSGAELRWEVSGRPSLAPSRGVPTRRWWCCAYLLTSTTRYCPCVSAMRTGWMPTPREMPTYGSWTASPRQRKSWSPRMVLPARSDASASGESPHAGSVYPCGGCPIRHSRFWSLVLHLLDEHPLDVRTSVACRCFHHQWQVRLSHRLRDRMTRGVCCFHTWRFTVGCD